MAAWDRVPEYGNDVTKSDLIRLGYTAETYNALAPWQRSEIRLNDSDFIKDHGAAQDASLWGNLDEGLEETLLDYAGAGGRIAAAGLKPVRGYLIGSGLLLGIGGAGYLAYKFKGKK